MRFGIYLNLFGHHQFGKPSGDQARVMHEAVEQARLCEQAGFDWVVLGERHHHPPGYSEILSSALWIAAHTNRIGIATAGIILPLYPPVLLAETLAHIDVLSGGRLTPGFVLGYRPEEFTAFEVPRSERLARFEEGLALLKLLWSGEPVTYRGRHHRLENVLVSPTPVQRPRPRVWNGCRVAPAIRRTAETCDGWTTSFNEEPTELTEKIAFYRSLPDSPSSLGREVIVLREGFCAATSQEARRILEEPLLGLYGEYAGWKRDSADHARYTTGWEAIANRIVVGSPAEVADTVAGYREIGADGLVLRIQPPGLPHVDAMRCIELLATNVLNAL